MSAPVGISALPLLTPTLPPPAELRLTRVQNDQWVWRRPVFVNPGSAAGECQTYANYRRSASLDPVAEATGRIVDLFV